VKEDEPKGVLCIEDNPDECELVRAILTDYEVTCTATIAETRPRLESGSYALLIIDEHLPDGSGMMLCNQLKKNGLDTPVIIISGDPYVTLGEALEVGAKIFLSKSSRSYVEDLKRFARKFAQLAKAEP
jgi:DNA-binding response OmpR family regulator